jgi:superfamily II DNA or RNA helicase
MIFSGTTVNSLLKKIQDITRIKNQYFVNYYMEGSEKIIPRIYQINARDQAVKGVDEGKNVILVLLPTGMGKTLIITLTIETLIENGTIKKDDKASTL